MAHPFFEKIGKKFKEFYEKLQYWVDDFFADIKTDRKKQAILAVTLIAVFFLTYLAVTLFAHSVKLRVTDDQGNPIDGALVRLYDDQGNLIDSKKTVNGTVTFDNLPRKSYKYKVCLDEVHCVDGRYYPDDPSSALIKLNPYTYRDDTPYISPSHPFPTPPATPFDGDNPGNGNTGGGNDLGGGGSGNGNSGGGNSGSTPDQNYIPDAALNVTVRESGSNRFVFSATVILKDAATNTHLAQGSTNNQGRIRFGVKQGTSITIQAIAEGYASSQPQAVAITQSEQSLDVSLDSLSGGQAAETTVTVSDNDGTPVESARIQIFVSGQSPQVDRLTSQNGRATFALPRTGPFNILVSKSGFNDALRTIQAGDDLQITLQRAASSASSSLTVMVKNKNGLAASSARIGVFKKIGSEYLPFSSQTANAQGIGQFNDLQAGWILRVFATSAAGTSSASKDLTVDSGINRIVIDLPGEYVYPCRSADAGQTRLDCPPIDRNQTCSDGQICPANYACPAYPTPTATTRNYCTGPDPDEPPSTLICPDGTVCPLDAECIPNTITGLHYHYGQYTCVIIPPSNHTPPLACPDGTICPANKACSPTDATRTRFTCESAVLPPGSGENNGTGYIYVNNTNPLTCPDGTSCQANQACTPKPSNPGQFTCTPFGGDPVTCQDGTTCRSPNQCIITITGQNTCGYIYPPEPTPTPGPLQCPNGGTCTLPNQCVQTAAGINTCGQPGTNTCQDGTTCFAPYRCFTAASGATTCARDYPCQNSNQCTANQQCIQTPIGQNTCGQPAPSTCQDGTNCLPPLQCTSINNGPSTCGRIYPTPTPGPIQCQNGNVCTPPEQCVQTTAGINTCGQPAPEPTPPTPTPSPVICPNGGTCTPPNQCVRTYTGQNTCGQPQTNTCQDGTNCFAPYKCYTLPSGNNICGRDYSCPANTCASNQQCIQTSTGQNTCGQPGTNTCQTGLQCTSPNQCMTNAAGQTTCGEVYPPGPTPPTPTPTPTTGQSYTLCKSATNGPTSFVINGYTFRLNDVSGAQSIALEVLIGNTQVCSAPSNAECIYQIGVTTSGNRLFEQESGVKLTVSSIDPRAQCTNLVAALACTGTNCNPQPATCSELGVVCGGNGVTYANACLARQAGAAYSSGVCTIQNCPDVYDPVCGLNNITYQNACKAGQDGQYYSAGACQPPLNAIRQNLAAGWNLIAPPDVGAYIATDCHYNNNYYFYAQEDKLLDTELANNNPIPVKPMQGATADMAYSNGYWEMSDHACTIYWENRTAQTSYSKPIRNGYWTLIGAPNTPLSLNQIRGDCQNLHEYVFFYDKQNGIMDRVRNDTALIPGTGYWIYSNGTIGTTCTLGEPVNTVTPTPTYDYPTPTPTPVAPVNPNPATPTPIISPTPTPLLQLPEPSASTRILVDYTTCQDTPSGASDEVLTGITYGGKSRFCRIKASDNSIVHIQKSGPNCQDPYAGYHVNPAKPNYLWTESGSVEVYGCGMEYNVNNQFVPRENEEFIGTKSSGFPACCGLTATTASGRTIPLRPEGQTWFAWEQPPGSDPMDANALTAQCRDNTVSVAIAPRGLTNIGHVALCSVPKLAIGEIGPTPTALWTGWPREVLSVDSPNDTCAEGESLCGVKANGNLLCCTMAPNYVAVSGSSRKTGNAQCNADELATGLPQGKLGCTAFTKAGATASFTAQLSVQKPFSCPQNMAVCNYDAAGGQGQCCKAG